MAPLQLTAEEINNVYVAKTFIHNQLQKRLTLETIAAAAEISPVQLGDWFPRIFGCPVHRYVHETRMKTAQFLLHHTERSVKHIGLTCGYCSAQSFATMFKRRFGLSPKEYRNSLS